MPGRFEDDRGVIQDILGPVDGVTHITTKAGCVRGNHVHARTTQWTWVLSGRLLVVHEKDGFRKRMEAGPGAMIIEAAGIPHAWKALEDTEVLVFTKGPRSGGNYESDTVRLAVPLLAP
jgi:quercetin dioxygenase-like cupin family protein